MPGAAANVADGHAGLHRLLDQADLLGGRPALPALHRRDHFNAGKGNVRIGVVVTIGVCLRLIELRRLSGQIEVQFTSLM